MKHQKRAMLNRLQRLLPEGTLADAAWLTAEGYPSSLRSRYVASGWLQSVTRGVFRRPLHRPGLDESVSPLRWQQVVISLQSIMKRPVAVGGRTALKLDGITHYASSAGPREVHLYGDEAAPGWLGKLPVETVFVFHNARKLFHGQAIPDAVVGLESVIADGDSSNPASIRGSLKWMYFGDGEWPMVVSTPERAILELLDELPARKVSIRPTC